MCYNRARGGRLKFRAQTLFMGLVVAVLATGVQAMPTPPAQADRSISSANYWSRFWSIDTFAPNASYLNNWSIKSLRQLDPDQAVELLDAKTSAQLQHEYWNIEREWALKEKFDQLDPWTQASFIDRYRNLSTHIMRTVFSQGVARQVRRAEKNSAAVRTFKSIETTVHQIMEGASGEASAGPFLTFGANTHIPSQKGSVWVRNDVAGKLSLDVALGQSWEELRDPLRRQFEMVSIQYGTSVMGLNPGLIYGGSSTRLTALVGKTFLPGFSGELLAIRSFNTQLSGLPLGRDEQLRFSFQRSF